MAAEMEVVTAVALPPSLSLEAQQYAWLATIPSYRDDSRHLDSEWVHDRYEEDYNPRRSAPRNRRESPGHLDPTSSKLKVENLHYELTTEELEGLFNRIGPVVRLNLRYDRAGRSEGVAYVTYEHPDDARQAIREFDGANANGQPIRLSIVPNGRDSRTRGGRNPFDTAVMPGRPLADRISVPRGPERTRGGRPKKTAEELDDEMADYFGGGSAGSAETGPAEKTTAPAAVDDMDMIE
ncbi:Proteasome component C1 [Verticillium dahliae VDG1]|nr:Proteasome component C1 [Verticillium dahliae VDG1]